ncbi:hypothetical protein [Deinococcus cellulosilyticus]|uniref:Uncharacterized protein n=1 Tax=Deinococcus cellulosilyticus (strain DSM 18568 / NBRC 106333 / KACC 11606 / 5516J-15) TaxID=1223518 RepID=A0A511N3Z7_DEIC1|nr:hypothetical protein [Deinococcus cellulosilyticus]GEM47101.1 hypothetical protein DC3_27360 [Deinococcus cellulosilyticus NBRC 106333 = KACC 11606]
MKLFAGLSLVVSVIVTWVLMLTHRPTEVLSHATLFSYHAVRPPLTPAQVLLLEKLSEQGIHLEAVVFTGTHEEVLLNIPQLGQLDWLSREEPSRRNAAAASRLKPLMRAVWLVAQEQLQQEDININQIKTLGLWYPRDAEGLEITNTLSKWGL